MRLLHQLICDALLETGQVADQVGVDTESTGGVLAGIVGALLAVPTVAFLNNAVQVLLAPDPSVEAEKQTEADAQGGLKGGLGFAEDPSRFSVACRAVGPVTMPDQMPKREVIAFSQASLFFKSFQIHRAVDTEKHVLVYTVVSTKLINGSPFNSISVVPTEIR